MKKVVFYEKWDGHFAPELGGHVKLELSGQYQWNLQHNQLTKYYLRKSPN